MKTKSFCLLAISALMTVACAKEPVSPPAPPVDPTGTVIEIAVDDMSKTFIGAPDEQGNRKVYWSESDQINVNGKESLPLPAEAQGATLVKFKFTDVLSYPYNIIYPASFLKGGSGSVVTLLAVQDYSKGSFATNTSPAVAYAASAGGNITLKNLCSVIKLNLTKGSHTDALRNILFIGGNDEQVSGDFTVDFQKATVTSLSTQKEDKQVRLYLGNKEIPDEGLEAYIVVPAGTYSQGFKVRIIDEQNHFMDKVKESSIELESGKIHTMEAFAFAPTGTLVAADNPDCAGSPDIIINNAAEYAAFANSFNAGNFEKYGSCNVSVTDDLDFSSSAENAVDFVTIGNEQYTFSGSFNFKGHSVKNVISVDKPLFYKLDNAVVSNLTVASSCSFMSSKSSTANHWGIVAREMTGGSVISSVNVDCPNTVYLVHAAEAVKTYGTIVGLVTGSSRINSCNVTGAFTYNNDGQQADASICFGHLAGLVDDAQSSITSCNVSGSMTFNEPSIKPTTKSTEPYFYVGGLVGKSTGTISDCEVSGALTYKDYPANAFVGGIAGALVHNTMTSCDMKGNISVDQSSGNVTDNLRLFLGGLVGRMTGSLLSSNNLASSMTVKTVVNDACIGGVIGKMMQDGGLEADIDNCVNKCNITQSVSGTNSMKIGGVIGLCHGTGATNIIENSKNYGNLSGDAKYMGGIVGYEDAMNQVRYCENTSDVILTDTRADANIGGICGYVGNASMDYCTNNGGVVSSGASAIVGGVVGNINHASALLTDSSNFGSVTAASGATHGLLVGNFTNLSGCNGCFVSGKCYTYSSSGTHIAHSVTKDNWKTEHTGGNYAAVSSKITNLTSSYDDSGEIKLKDAELRILLVGNSFTDDAAKQLPGLINAAGLSSKITIAHLYAGGRIMLEYNNWSLSDYTLYKYEAGVNTDSWTTHSSKVSINAVAQDGRWDIITLQEHTGNYHGWIWDADEKSYFDGVYNKLKSIQPKAKFYYIFSQAYYDMNKIGSASRPYMTWPLDKAKSSQLQMFSVMIDYLKTMLADQNFDGLIASGTFLQNLRTSSVETANDLTRDGYHMDYGASRYGAAALVFETLITPKFGINLDSNSYRISTSSTEEGKWSTPVTDANKPTILKAARYAMQNPYEITDMSSPTPPCSLKGSGTSSDPYLVESDADMVQIGYGLKASTLVYYKLTADVDMKNYSSWEPSSNTVSDKRMYFDGQNHTISNFKCSGQAQSSLFGALSNSTVKDLTFSNCSVTNNGTCAIVATAMSGTSTLQNVNVTSSTVTGTSTASGNAGGLVASFSGTVSKCSFTGNLSVAITGTYKAFAGGIIGEATAATTIERCFVNVAMTTTGSAENGQGGGIIGGSKKDIATTIRNCYSQGSISKMSYSGGIAGEVSKGSTVTCCYSTMSITGSYADGGIVGRACNYVNPNSSGTYHTDIDISISKCIAWNPSMTTTKAVSPSNGYSSGAVLGFTVFKNTLSDCYRIPTMSFAMYDPTTFASYNTLVDQANSGPSSEYVQMGGAETYYMPYHGKAAGSGDTVSSVALSLAWDTTVWNLSSSLPTLK